MSFLLTGAVRVDGSLILYVISSFFDNIRIHGLSKTFTLVKFVCPFKILILNVFSSGLKFTFENDQFYLEEAIGHDFSDWEGK